MAITISVSSTIGGSCKTTVACLFTYFLSTNYKVLAIDLCGQCHMSEVFLSDHDGLTICNAFETGDVASNIVPITNNLHILPGDKWVGELPASLYSEGCSAEEVVSFLSDFVNRAKATYDFVIIDTPDVSAEELFNLSLSVSDFAIMTYSPNKIKLVEKWLDKLRHVQDEFNSNLMIAGVLRTRFNKIEASHKFYSQEVYMRYPEHCWNSVFPNSPRFANIDIHTIRKANIISAFKPLYDELILCLLNMRQGIK